jgi:hypothetical protein
MRKTNSLLSTVKGLIRPALGASPRNLQIHEDKIKYPALLLIESSPVQIDRNSAYIEMEPHRREEFSNSEFINSTIPGQLRRIPAREREFPVSREEAPIAIDNFSPAERNPS